MDQRIAFCTSADGVSIAYAVTGTGAPVVYVGGFPTHLEVEWERPSSRALLEALSAGATLVRYDIRGCGLSDTAVEDFSVEALVGDLSAVIEAVGFDTFALLSLGMLGGVTAMTYAATHPDRVAHLALCSAFARGDRIATQERRDTLIDYTEKFGFPVLEYIESPDPTASMDRTGRDMVHLAAAPHVQASLLRTWYAVDVTPHLPSLSMPVTVLHGRGDRLVPFAEGRALAAQIPGAAFVPLEGNTGGALTERDSTIPAIRRALALESAAPVRRGARFHTVLFSDIVGHTEMMQRIGDAHGRAVLREYERITRDALKSHGGNEVKTDGDSFMAAFASASAAVECAIAMQREFARYSGSADEPIVVRMGLNIGEPIEEDGDFYGSAVILAARIQALAEGGEILVPEALRHLLAGKSFTFADRGEFALKGFDDAVRLYAVRWREEPGT